MAELCPPGLTDGDDGPLADSHPGTGQLGEQGGLDGRVEADQQT